MATDDLLTADEAKRYVGIGVNDATKGALLAQHITAVSRLLAKRVGSIVQGTLTELHDGGMPYIYLDNHPVKQIVEVVEYDGITAATLTAESNTSKPITGYTADLTSGKITRRDDNMTSFFPSGIDNISVQYVAGRYASTSTVDERYKMAAGLILKNAWRAHEPATTVDGDFDVPQASFPRFTIPNAVKELLGDEWRAGSGVGD